MVLGFDFLWHSIFFSLFLLTLSLRAPLIGGTREVTCGYKRRTTTRRLLGPAPYISDIQMMHIQVLSLVSNIFFHYQQNIFC